MRVPEIFQDLLVGYLLGIEFNSRDLGMAGHAGADILVAGVLRMAAGKTARDRLHAGYALEFRLHAPKTAATEIRHLRLVCIHTLSEAGCNASQKQGCGQQQTSCFLVC